MTTNFIYILKDPKTLDVVYVGKTKNTNKRYKDHCRKCKGKYRSFLDKWKNNLISNGDKPLMDIIFECDSNEVDKWEKHFISEYRNKFNILNMTDGGDGLQNPSEEVRRKIGLKSKGRIPTKETRDKLSKAHYNGGNPIICYNQNGEFVGEFINSRRASEQLNLNYRNISKTLNGGEHFIKGYTFFYKDEDLLQEKLTKRISKTIKTGKRFLRISKDGSVKTYTNILEASRDNCCNFRNIWLCLNGKRKTCVGYNWKYEDDLQKTNI